ncbi:DNA-3-methyladenine glycosylase [Rhizobium sp. CFBP 8762]|uniref:DNA-3-methyladenine glycosylase n=1 Tax=Rhizobium sp. CFBP 8762 TaxID=2775279 RepID=UPI00177D2149|nr:DNA-3-methyladenine glycosylase [Rhizobium sp. CFBP 8762]MBD8556630.1 DNA-3-methyladenine glycosylase [Rhizobium sp. CFBP 8762]
MTISLTKAFFERDVVDVARALVGCKLTVNGIGGRIVETEAYHREDEASHSFRGETARNAAMFGPAGCAYVYRSYGIHWCLNVTTGHGSAVLIRALEPLLGVDVMQQRRGMDALRLLCSGPGRLCAALHVDLSLNGQAINQPPFALWHGVTAGKVVSGPRIGITKNVGQPWRFGLEGSAFLSKPLVPTRPDHRQGAPSAE